MCDYSCKISSSVSSNRTMSWAGCSISKQSTPQTSNHGCQSKIDTCFWFAPWVIQKEAQLPSHLHMQLKQGNCIFFNCFMDPKNDRCLHWEERTIREIDFHLTCVSLDLMIGLEVPLREWSPKSKSKWTFLHSRIYHHKNAQQWATTSIYAISRIFYAIAQFLTFVQIGKLANHCITD
jgi:hypothetical protein